MAHVMVPYNSNSFFVWIFLSPGVHTFWAKGPHRLTLLLAYLSFLGSTFFEAGHMKILFRPLGLFVLHIKKKTLFIVRVNPSDPQADPTRN